jgi:hypothetical protein
MCDPYQTNHAATLVHFNLEIDPITPTDTYWTQG